MIRVDCYLAVLKKYREQYPNAHFEVITRTAGSILSPDWSLLTYCKDNNIPFERYRVLLIDQLKRRQGVKEKLEELKEIAKTKDLFLVCYEKDASKCHRSIIKEMMEEL